MTKRSKVMSELIFAIDEEIGEPNLFVGRKEELDFFLNWAKRAKSRLSQSTAILARRKKGKTALVQRVYNIIYSQNDPLTIPFYFKIAETAISKLDFAVLFYRSLLSQYFAFQKREPDLAKQVLPLDRLLKFAQGDGFLISDIEQMKEIEQKKSSDQAWEFARAAGHRIAGIKDQRIVQIIDEFQYLNTYIYTNSNHTRRVELASSYLGTAESKVSPQIITSSYIGWLGIIIRKMVGRYREYYLGNMPNEEALETVYNYSNFYESEINQQSAPYIAGVCYNDPFYIAQMFRSDFPGKDLTSEEGVRAILKFETTAGKGTIARTWLEYIWDAFDRVNEQNAKKIVLYLAKYGDEERDREQILKDLGLPLTDRELEERLHKLVKADIIADGSSNFRYKGLGDEMFAMVFRRIYGEEIERLDLQDIEQDIENRVKKAKKQVAYYRGLAAEYRVMNQLHFAVLKGVSLSDIVYNPQKNLELTRFATIKKHGFQVDQEKRIEVDLYAQSENVKGVDLVVEVKDWREKLTKVKLEEFFRKKELLTGFLKKKTGFIFYSEKGFAKAQEKLLKDNEVMFTDAGRLERRASNYLDKM